MTTQPAFIPQRQIHVLVNMAKTHHNLTILPNHAGNFRVIERGEILGEVAFTPKSKLVCYKGRLKKAIINQLEKHLSNYYSYAF